MAPKRKTSSYEKFKNATLSGEGCYAACCVRCVEFREEMYYGLISSVANLAVRAVILSSVAYIAVRAVILSSVAYMAVKAVILSSMIYIAVKAVNFSSLAD